MLAAIQALTAELSALEDVLNLTHADFDHFHEQERSYLEGLKEPPLKDHISVRYIQALDEVAVRQYVISHPYQFHTSFIHITERCGTQQGKLPITHLWIFMLVVFSKCKSLSIKLESKSMEHIRSFKMQRPWLHTWKSNSGSINDGRLEVSPIIISVKKLHF